ncbi:MAG: hypothetical protein A2Y88_14160 [Chloroflexi bacterium RBG_13_48_10]|nr:MAG: hypothetical protein A2Y88_14160 [Chloroflexi bacterium RBG_13_48_10]
MEPLVNAKGSELYWVQPLTMRNNFILRSGERIFGRLEFRSVFSSLVQAVAAHETWTFNQVGFISPRVIVRRSGSESDLASYQPKWTGTEGQIKLSRGEVYIWRVANFWSTRYAIANKDGTEIVTYQSGSDEKKISNLFKQQARVHITLEAWQLSELPLIVMLGWYLVILHYSDSSAAAVIATMA